MLTCHTGTIAGACDTVECVVTVDEGVEDCRGEGSWAHRNAVVQAFQKPSFQLICYAYQWDLQHKPNNALHSRYFPYNACNPGVRCMFGARLGLVIDMPK